MRAYWSYIEALTTQGFGSAEAVATMATYHGLAPKMTLAAAAYNESSFAYAGSLLDAAEAKAASESERAKLTVMRQGLHHGLLTWRAYYATLNATNCTGLLPGVPCDEGYVGGGLDKGGGYAEACTCDVRQLLAAARALATFRKTIMASAAVNVFWTSWAELNQGKAQDCNPCFGGYTGVHLAAFAGDLDASVALSVSRWSLRFDPEDRGRSAQPPWSSPHLKLNRSQWVDESRVDYGWGNNRAGIAWSSAHGGKAYRGVGWYRLQFRLPPLQQPPQGLAFSRGRRDNPDKMQLVQPNSTWASGETSVWLNGRSLGVVSAAAAASAPTHTLAVPAAIWAAADGGLHTLALRVDGDDGLLGRLWLVGGSG